MGLKSYYYKELAYFGPLLYTDSIIQFPNDFHVSNVSGGKIDEFAIPLRIMAGLTFRI